MKTMEKKEKKKGNNTQWNDQTNVGINSGFKISLVLKENGLEQFLYFHIASISIVFIGGKDTAARATTTLAKNGDIDKDD